MARLLHRLGSVAARRPVAVVLLWALVLASAGGAMAAWQRPMTQEFELPGSDFSRVLDDLGEQIPELAGGSGTVVVHSDRPITAEQRDAFDEVRRAWLDEPRVSGVVDPFAAQDQLDRSDRSLDRAQQRLEAGQSRLEQGREQLAGLEGLVEQGRADIARLERTTPDDPTLPARVQGQADLERRLATGREQLAEAERRLSAGRQSYDAAADLREAGQGIRTVSEDGGTALVQIRFDRPVPEIDPDELEQIREIGDRLTESGLEVDYGQELVFENEVGGLAEILGLAMAAIVLLVMLGSLVLSGLPLGVAFVGVGVSSLGAFALTRWLEIQQMAPVLGTMLGLAVGIDYALFIVNRHRHQLADLVHDGRTPTRDAILRSIAMATGTAGSAVVVAGSTVVIALAALTVSGIPTLVQMGLLAAATVVVTVLVALTLTPALLALVGRRAVPRTARRAARAAAAGTTRRTWPERWVDLVTRRATAVVLVVVTLLGVMALPAAGLRLGLPDGGSESPDSTAFRAYERVADAFGAGANGPVLVSADYPAAVAEDDLVAEQAAVARAITSVEPSAQVLPVGVSEDRRTVAFQVLPAEGPSAQSTVALVEDLRALADGEQADDGRWLDLRSVIPGTDASERSARAGDAQLGVTGQTVANIEVSERLAGALPLYLALVIGLSLILLTVVFRSLVVPLLATAGFLLSVGAAFGAIVAVYQWGWLGELFGVHQPGAVFSFMPTLLIGILFGLAMDYQMFLVSGMRESYVHGESARAAVRSGFTSGARVVLAAGLIMVSVFAGFIHSPMSMARPIGFGLAIGVAVDAFLVRMTLTPAVMSLLGDRAWWMPVWLDRLLPDLDVEGSRLVEDERARAASERERDEVLV